MRFYFIFDYVSFIFSVIPNVHIYNNHYNIKHKFHHHCNEKRSITFGYD